MGILRRMNSFRWSIILWTGHSETDYWVYQFAIMRSSATSLTVNLLHMCRMFVGCGTYFSLAVLKSNAIALHISDVLYFTVPIALLIVCFIFMSRSLYVIRFINYNKYQNQLLQTKHKPNQQTQFDSSIHHRSRIIDLILKLRLNVIKM